MAAKLGVNLLREKHKSISLMLIDLQMPDLSGLEVLQAANTEGINVPAIMITAHSSEQVITDAFRLGIHDYLKKPVDVDKLNVAITRALAETRLRHEKAALTIQLQEQVTRLTALSDVGRSVISTLNIGTVLSRILEAGVSLTHAEHGFIALRDSKTDQLYLRAMMDFGDKQVETVQVPVNDRLLTQALKNGQPIRISRPSEGRAMKVSTGLLVHSLINVPIFYQNQPLGVLSVNNHTQRRNFTKGDETLLTSLADYAAIAIGNASSYEKAKQEIEERKRAEAALQNANSEIAQLIASLSSILIVISPKIQVVHWNPSAHKIFNIPKEDAVGVRLDDLGIQWRFNPIAKGIDQTRKDGLPQYLDPIPFKRLELPPTRWCRCWDWSRSSMLRWPICWPTSVSRPN